jgi:multidrug efflux pump subunit AcrB
MISFRSILWLSIICLVSVLAWRSLPIKLKPRDVYASIAINISAPGYSPELIETELTAPIESIISSIEGIRGVSTTSATGSASISFSLEKSTNIIITRLTIDDALHYL